MAETLTCSLRTEISCKLNRLPLRFFDRNKAGEILSRVTSDLDKVAEVLQTGLLKLIAEEYYKGRNVIKAYNHEKQSIEQVRAAAEDNRISSQKADFLTNCVNPLIRLLTRIAHVVTAVIAGKAMIEGRMTVGVVQAFFQYVNQTAEPMTEASYMINSLQSAIASAERTFELLDEEEEVPDRRLR